MSACTAYGDLLIGTDLDASIHVQEEETGKITVRVAWEKVSCGQPYLTVDWMEKMQNIQHMWYPHCGFDRTLRVDWQDAVKSHIARSAPVWVLFDQAGNNRLTVALSDAMSDVDAWLGVREESGEIKCSLRIPLDRTGLSCDYQVTLWRNYAPVSFAQALRQVADWWVQCGYIPMPVPENARLPLYSCWYSFHQNTVADEILAECTRARQLGFETVIIDDGWQTLDGNRGYGYCGDWQPCTDKIPDMAALIREIHALGMKCMLWYSVPFVGYHSAHWEQFRDKLLRDVPGLSCGIMDPRYPEVRKYLQSTYLDALRRFDLDGFKLDFIDDFLPTAQAPAPNDRMDFIRVEDAVLSLMQNVMQALRREKQDILIEFRQHYTGPAMRTFGNMFRVGDCPADPLQNKVGMVDLRLLSGSTAVHSDMLMWHPEETVECAARQILHVLFSVPQISVRLDRIPEEHLKMLSFWMDFVRRHRALLAAPMEVTSPQHLYPLVRTELDGEEAVCVYDQVVTPVHENSVTYLFNAGADREMVLRSDANCTYTADVFNCMGVLQERRDVVCAPLGCIAVPVSGYAVLQTKK